MKRRDVGELTDAQLVERFATIALAQEKATLHDEYAKYNKLFDEMELVAGELKSRPGDQRRRLVVLYTHNSPEVRLKAAIHTLAIALEDAKNVLKIIKDRGEFPPAADAYGMLSALDEGRYIPE